MALFPRSWLSVVQTPLIQFLHIGDYKTGTTWLQRRVFANDPRIHLVGEGTTESNLAAWASLENLIYDQTLDTTAWRKELDQLIHNEAVHGQTVLGISRESLICGDPIYFDGWEETAVRLRECFGQTKIICTFREQFSLLASLYSTYVKLGGILSMRELYLDATHREQLLSRLDYHRIAQRYVSLFGAENCLFLTFDELRSHPDTYLDKVYRFIGLAAPGIPSLAGKQPNRSLSSGALALQRILNRAVRSMFHPGAYAPLLEPVIARIIRTLRPVPDKRRRQRAALLSSEVRQVTGKNYPIENDVFIAVARKLSERLSFGKPKKISGEIIESLIGPVSESNVGFEKLLGRSLRPLGWHVAE